MVFTDYFFIFIAKYLHLLAGAIALIWFWKAPKEQKKDIVIFSIIALLAIYAAGKISAWLYFNPRPFVVGDFTPLVLHKPDNGFPSKHVLLVSAIASIIFPFSKKVSASVWLIASLVGIARVYVGVHHSVDVIGSVVISIAMSTFVYFIFKNLILSKR